MPVNILTFVTKTSLINAFLAKTKLYLCIWIAFLLAVGFSIMSPATALAGPTDPPVYALQWGSINDDQFTFPSGIAVDAAGNVYVAERDSNRIQKFNSAGAFLAKWGTFGTRAAQSGTRRGVVWHDLGMLTCYAIPKPTRCACTAPVRYSDLDTSSTTPAGNHMNFSRPESTDYHSYLLRIWRDGPQRSWRASMHCSATGTLHHFADMEHLFAFLQARTDGIDELIIGEPDE